MKQNIVVTSMLFGAVIMLSACGAKIPTQEQIKETANATQQKVEEVKDSGKKIAGNMEDAVMMDEPMKCTWEEEGGTSGVSYVDGEKVNNMIHNMPVGPNGELGDSYTISDGEWMYMWSSLSNQGTKMKMNKEMAEQRDLPEVNVPKDEQMPENKFDGLGDVSTQGNHVCGKWKADASVFIPPTNITFVDMDEMMKQMNLSIPDGDMQ